MVRVHRWVESDKVRQMCIKYQYYTRGDVTAYSNMLRMADEAEDSIEAIKQIAIDIYDHSDVQDERDYTPAEYVANIMGEILRECMNLYVELDEGEVIQHYFKEG